MKQNTENDDRGERYRPYIRRTKPMRIERLDEKKNDEELMIRLLIDLVEKNDGLIKNEDIIKITGVTTKELNRKKLNRILPKYSIRLESGHWKIKKLKNIKEEYEHFKIDIKDRIKRRVMKSFNDEINEQCLKKYDQSVPELLDDLTKIINGKSEEDDLVYQLVIDKQKDIFNKTGVKVSIKDIIESSIKLSFLLEKR